jgi:hypothetical protein
MHKGRRNRCNPFVLNILTCKPLSLNILQANSANPASQAFQRGRGEGDTLKLWFSRKQTRPSQPIESFLERYP